jgi:hypothetical protein
MSAAPKGLGIHSLCKPGRDAFGNALTTTSPKVPRPRARQCATMPLHEGYNFIQKEARAELAIRVRLGQRECVIDVGKVLPRGRPAPPEKSVSLDDLGNFPKAASVDRHRKRHLMAKSTAPMLLQGTLDLPILHSLSRGTIHGYAIALNGAVSAARQPETWGRLSTASARGLARQPR